MRGADIRGADMRGEDIRGADSRGAAMRGSAMRGSAMRGSAMRGSAMRGSDRVPSNRGDSTRGACIRGASMRGAGTRSAGSARMPGWKLCRCGLISNGLPRGELTRVPGELTRVPGEITRVPGAFTRVGGALTRVGGSATRVPGRALPRNTSGARTVGSTRGRSGIARVPVNAGRRPGPNTVGPSKRDSPLGTRIDVGTRRPPTMSPGRKAGAHVTPRTPCPPPRDTPANLTPGPPANALLAKPVRGRYCTPTTVRPPGKSPLKRKGVKNRDRPNPSHVKQAKNGRAKKNGRGKNTVRGNGVKNGWKKNGSPNPIVMNPP